MNIKPINVLMFMAGVVLVYSGIKGYKPQDVLSWAIGGGKPAKWISPSDSSGSSDTGGNNLFGLPNNNPLDMQLSDTTPNTNSVNPVDGGIVSV